MSTGISEPPHSPSSAAHLLPDQMSPAARAHFSAFAHLRKAHAAPPPVSAIAARSSIM
jgi:hypothetical protein